MRTLCTALVIAAAFALPVFTEAKTVSSAYNGGYSTFIPKGNVRSFTTVLPQNAKITYADGFNETTYTASVGAAKIRIRAMYEAAPDTVSLIQEKKWEIRDIDPSVRIIIEGEPVTLRATVKGTLLVYQYRNAKKKAAVIQRTLITSQGQFVYIMDCVAPTGSFYAYEQIFNIAMGGFLAAEQQFVPEAKKVKTSDTVKKSQIKINQSELDSMGLKEGANTDSAEPKAEPEQKEQSPAEQSEPDQGASPSKDTQEEAPAQNPQPDNSSADAQQKDDTGTTMVNQNPSK